MQLEQFGLRLLLDAIAASVGHTLAHAAESIVALAHEAGLAEASLLAHHDARSVLDVSVQTGGGTGRAALLEHLVLRRASFLYNCKHFISIIEL